MTEMPNDYIDFASYLHNPQNESFMTNEEKIAIECWESAHKLGFTSSCREQLVILLSKYFSYHNNLENVGLEFQYHKLKENVIKHNMIGLVLYGYYKLNETTIKLCDYITQNNKNIEITVNSVCIYLLKHFTMEEQIKYCKLTPNYDKHCE